MSEKLVYRVSECAALLDCAPSTLYDCLARGEGPPSVRLGRKILIPVAAFDEWLRRGSEPRENRNGGLPPP